MQRQKPIPGRERRNRGVIDPFTLGFLISLIGGLVVVSTHSGDPADNEQQETANQALPAVKTNQ